MLCNNKFYAYRDYVYSYIPLTRSYIALRAVIFAIRRVILFLRNSCGRFLSLTKIIFYYKRRFANAYTSSTDSVGPPSPRSHPKNLRFWGPRRGRHFTIYRVMLRTEDYI